MERQTRQEYIHDLEVVQDLVARQFNNNLFVFLRIIIQFKCYTNVRGNFAFDRKSG